jgi:ubiquinone/menaquinone biosynthesis C-methylase UbiE
MRGEIGSVEEFFASGHKEIDDLRSYINSLGISLQWAKAVDFGCGVGRSTQALTKYFDKVYGVDIAPSMIHLAKDYNQYGQKCEYILNGLNDLSIFGDNSVDFIYSLGTLHTMPPHYSKVYITEFLRILLPGGLAIFQLVAEPARTMKGTFFRITPTPFLNLYRRAKYGFEIYSMKKKLVLELVKRYGGTILDIKSDRTAGDGWISLQYCMLKELSSSLKPS